MLVAVNADTHTHTHAHMRHQSYAQVAISEAYCQRENAFYLKQREECIKGNA